MFAFFQRCDVAFQIRAQFIERYLGLSQPLRRGFEMFNRSQENPSDVRVLYVSVHCRALNAPPARPFHDQ